MVSDDTPGELSQKLQEAMRLLELQPEGWVNQEILKHMFMMSLSCIGMFELSWESARQEDMLRRGEEARTMAATLVKVCTAEFKLQKVN